MTADRAELSAVRVLLARAERAAHVVGEIRYAPEVADDLFRSLPSPPWAPGSDRLVGPQDVIEVWGIPVKVDPMLPRNVIELRDRRGALLETLAVDMPEELRAPVTLVEFLAAMLDRDDEEAVRPTAVISGGRPAPEILNCIGRTGHGGCGWKVDVSGTPREEVNRLAREHDLTHATAAERRALRDVEAKRRILELHSYPHECPGHGNVVSDPEFQDGTYGGPCDTLRLLALRYADHEDYREEWAP